jgi:hypothetical protein
MHSARESYIADLKRIESIAKARQEGPYAVIARKLADLLLSEWNAGIRASIEDAARIIGRGEGRVTEAEVDALLRDLSNRLGLDLVARVRGRFDQLVFQTYDLGQRDVLNAAPSFNVTDQAAIRWLNGDGAYWIGQYYGKWVSAKIANLAEDVLRQGLSRADAGSAFNRAFGDQFNRSAAYWEGFANNVTTRAREFAHTEGYVKGRILFLRVDAVVDNRTSDICRGLDGVILPVSWAVRTRDKLMAARNPERVKRIAPWVNFDKLRGKRVGRLRQSMALPPYHFHCRTVTTAVTEELDAVGWEGKILE